MGVAVVGVVFFGLLTGGAAPAASAVTPALRAQLTEAHLSPGTVNGAVATFTPLFRSGGLLQQPAADRPGVSVGRRHHVDPTTSAFSGAASSALAKDFVGAVEVLLFFNIGFWVLTALLSLALPRARSAGSSGASAAH